MHSTQPAWSTPVRYAEVDQQGIAFNAHYLTWCDEAMGAFCQARGLLATAERVHLVSSTLTWRSSATWGDVVEVDAECVRVGTSSLDMRFVVRVADRVCCEVLTTYVNARDGAAEALTDAERSALSRR